MKISQYCQRQRYRHVELEQFWQALASRGFVSDSWAFLLLFCCMRETISGWLLVTSQPNIISSSFEYTHRLNDKLIQNEIHLKNNLLLIIVNVSASTEAFVGTVCLIAARRSVSGRTGCRRCGRVVVVKYQTMRCVS